MKIRLSVGLSALWLLCVAFSCRAQETTATLSTSERARMAQLQARLQPLLKIGQETVPLEWEGNALVARFHTREFKVYAGNWHDGYATELQTEIGPQSDGFILRLELKSGRYNGKEIWPIENRGPYWQLWQDAVPLNVLNPKPKIIEFPDVPLRHWTYDALRQLSRDGLIENMPWEWGNRIPMTRHYFAVALARFLDRRSLVDQADLPYGKYIQAAKPPIPEQYRETVRLLMREFAWDIQQLGMKTPLDFPYYRGEPNVLPQYLRVELRYNNDNALRDQIERVINQWALDDTRQQLQLKEDE